MDSYWEGRGQLGVDLGVFGGPVVLEVVTAEEGLRTQRAPVRPLARVVAHVSVTVGFGREGLAAVLAQVATVVTCTVTL